MGQSIGFYGAAETVTGSRHLLKVDKKNILVDCGMFQGNHELRDRNWEDLPVDPREIDAVIITHGHLDHIGWLPRLVALGYSGPIYATKATIELSKISLPDSGRLQEEDARYAGKHSHYGKSIQPLYDEKAAFACLKHFRPVEYNTFHELPGKAQFRFLTAGHILGSAFAEIYFEDGTGLLMSGDLGRYNTPIIKDPTTVESIDYLVIESTYGDRIHSHEDPLDKIASIVDDTMRTGGALIIPSFAIGRTQELLYYFRVLQNQGRMPRIPIYIDSPMAASVTHVYQSAKEELDEEMLQSVEEGRSELEPDGIVFVRDRETSKALNAQHGPLIIVSGSGMANGGRVTHHLMNRLPHEKTTVLFTGYQAEGTLGRRLIEGAEVVHIHGQEVEVRARIEKVNALSAHADQSEMLRWLSGFKRPPKQTFIVHGEPTAQMTLKRKITEQFGWSTIIPKQAESFNLD